MVGFINSLPGAVAQGIIWGIMAIGVYLTFKVLDIADLTVDGSFATGGVVFAVGISSGMNVALAMLLAFLAGAAAGLATGIFHTKFGIPAILAGILTQLALWSVNLRITTGRANMLVSVDKYNLVLSSRYMTKAIIVGAAVALAIIIAMYWFYGTERGQSLRATGNNQNMARANGINTDNNKIIGLTISNGVVAMAGALLSQYQGFADINMGRGAIVIGLASIIIGEVLLGKIFKNYALRMLSSIIGGIIYYIVMTLVLSLGLNANDLKLFSALVVAVFLAIPYWKKKIFEARVGKEAA